MTVSILLADDHSMMRQGLKLVLETQSDFVVCGLAADGLEALALAERLKPDVAIVDVQMPGLSGLEVVRRIRQQNSRCRIIVLSMYDEEEFVLSAMRDGAQGYVLKESSAENLVQAVRAVLAGEHYLSPRLAERALRAYLTQPSAAIDDEYEKLTDREREILQLSAEGLTYAQIAGRLSISPRTVEVHRANLRRKLGMHSQLDLVAYARKKKLIP